MKITFDFKETIYFYEFSSLVIILDILGELDCPQNGTRISTKDPNIFGWAKNSGVEENTKLTPHIQFYSDKCLKST